MNFKSIYITCLLISLHHSQAVYASLEVFTTTTNVANLVEQVGGDKVKVTSLTKGAQDPHYVEAKPSFMLNISRADLVVSVGLGLESAWLPAVIGGSRNASISRGQKGSLILGEHISVLDIPNGETSRVDGDVHPEGNPHFMLDPGRVSQLADVVAAKLAELDPSNKEYFFNRSKMLKNELDRKLSGWQQQIKQSGIKQIVTYHKTLRYFLDRFEIKIAGQIEPKPGIPPSSNHILSTINLCKQQNIKLILVENYFDEKPARRIADEVKGLKVTTIPVAVGGSPNVNSLIDLYDQLINALTTK